MDGLLYTHCMVRLRKRWKYKNLFIVCVGILGAVCLSRIDAFREILLHLGSWGYVGAFFGGILFVSTFTVATGGIILFSLAQYLHPVEIALVAGLGAVVGDLLIFRLIKNDLQTELRTIYNSRLNGRHISRLLHTKYFSWSLPVIGAIIIASPLPDEIGISLMGLSKIKTFKFVFVSFLLNTIGIFLAVSASLVV